ncbi:MAG: rubrerythrin family protein [Candidatus Bathyarchaeota archaeon]|nr:rubrerythrin family protein [Candidatus Bathyarchaeota archaeon]MDW8040804.1 rubrerythrin family protein [Nitrososphaerota archaeon]
MRKMTEDNLKSAFAGESQAYMRYMIFAKKAEEEGYPNVARLFRAIAYAEQVHATNHYNVLGMIRSSPDNLQVAIDGEIYEVNEMYPAYNAVAKLQEEKGAQKTTDWALQAEKVHAGMFQKAKQAVEGGKDIKLGPIYICDVCGYTVESEAPGRCPVCGASKEKFRKF